MQLKIWESLFKENDKEFEGFLIDLAQYVGSNIKLNIKKYKYFIKPYILNYSKVYRIWQDYYKDDIFILPKQDYYACTLSKNALKEMIDENDYEDNLITIHSGIGFEPLQILKDNIDKFPKKEFSFLQRTIIMNDYQKEVLLLKINSTKNFY